MTATRPLVCVSSIAAFLLASFASKNTAHAASLYWDGSADTSWASLNNWTSDQGTEVTPGAIPGASDTAIFNFTGTVTNQIATLGSSRSVGGLIFDTNSTTAIALGASVNDFTLTLGASGLTTNTGAAAHLINSGITLSVAQTWTSNSTNVLSIAGTLTTGANNLIIAGAGGGFALNGAASVNGLSTWTNNGTAGFSVAGTTTLTNNLTLDGAGAFTLGQITNSGGNRSLTISGTGARTLANLNGSNDGTNRTLTLNINSANVNAGSLNNGGSSTQSSFIKNGTGTLTVNGTNNTFGGTLTINDGAVVINAATVSNNPALSLGATGTGTPILTVNAAYKVGSITQAATSNAGTINGTGSLNLNADRTFNIGDTAGAVDLTISVPVSNGDSTARGITKSGAGVLQFDGTNTFSGTMTISAGTVIQNASPTAAGALTFNGSVGSTPTLTVNSTFVHRLGGNVQTNTGTTGATINGAGSLGLFNNRSFIVNDTTAADDLVIAASIVDGDATARSILKEQVGRLVFQGTNAYTGTTEIYRGELVLDHSANTGSKLPDAANARMRGGSLILSGNASAPVTETVLALLAENGSNTVALQHNGQAVTLAMGPITRTVGQGLLNFTTNNAANVFQTTNTNNEFGIIGGYATFNGERFATNDGTGKLAAVASAVQSNRSQWQAGQHVVVDAALTGSLATSAVTSLTFDAATANTLQLDNPGAALMVRAGGILVGSDVGANNTTISGGQLYVQSLLAANAELILTNLSGGTLAISSNIGSSDAPLAFTQQLTVGGYGLTELTGRNTYNGATNIQGNVRIGGGHAINDYTQLNISAGGNNVVLDLNGSTEIVGSLSGGTFSNRGIGEIKLGSGTLVVNGTASPTWAGNISGAGTLIKRGSGSLTSGTNTNTMTGTVQILGGTFDLNGNNGGFTSVATFLLRGGSMLSEQNQGGSVDKFGNTSVIQLEGTGGNGLRVTSNQTSARTETAGKLELNAGANVIVMTNTAGTPVTSITTLAFSDPTDAFNRTNNATLLARSGIADFGGTSTVNSNRVTFVSGITGDLVGGGGSAATNVSILPFAIGGTGNTSHPGDTFLTVGTNGLRPLKTDTEFATDYTTALATDNFSATVTALSQATKTLNSLRVDNSAGNVDFGGSAGSTLTLTSGALLVSAGANVNDTVIAGYDQILAGANDANADELIVHVTTSNATSADATLAINSAIANNGGAATSLTKSGAGTLILGAVNGYTGVTTVNQGVLQFSAGNQLGSDGPIRLAGGTLNWGGSNTTDISTKTDLSARVVELIGPSVFVTPVGAGNILTVGNRIDVGSNNVTLVNPIGNNGVGGLTKAGNGTLTLSAAPTYTGPTLVTEGALNFQTIGSGATQALYVFSAGGTVSSTVTNGLNVQSLIAGGFFSGAGTATTAGNVTVNGGAVNIGNGTSDDFLLIGWRDSSAVAAAANVNFSGLADFQAASGVNIDVGQIAIGAFNSGLTGTASTTKGSLLLPTNPLAVNTITAGSIVIGNSPASTFNNTGGATSTVALGGGTTAIRTNSLTIGGMRSSAAMSISPGGTFILRGVSGGSTGTNLFIADTDATATNADGIASLDLTGATAVDIKANHLVIGRLGGTPVTTGTASGQGTLTFGTGTIEAATVRLADANFRTGITTNAAETLGRINMNGGTFRFQDLSKGSGTADFNWNSGTIQNPNGADLVNQNVTVELLTVSPHNFTVDSGRTATFAATAGFTGDGSLTKNGAGTLVLSGTSNHTGATSVDAGTLLVNGSLSGSEIFVKAGTLGGTGTLPMPITIGDVSGVGDAFLAPGNGIGTLNAGLIFFESDSVFALEINSLALATDLLNATGEVFLMEGAKLQIADLGNAILSGGQTFKLIEAAGGVNGIFDGLPDATHLVVNGNEFTIEYTATAVELVSVPEPATAMTLMGGLASLVAFRRNRKRQS